VAIAISWTGSVPTRISALGIEFAASNRRAFLDVLAVVMVYFGLAFLIYVACDVVAWYSKYYEAEWDLKEWDNGERPMIYGTQTFWSATLLFGRTPRLVIAQRLVFDAILPLLVWLYALFSVLRARSWLG
jgi:hypothetical protein